MLAMLDLEPGGEITREWLERGPCAMSAVNLSEVVAKLSERGGTELSIRRITSRLGIEVVPFDASDAVGAGLLRAATRPFGLSLGDRACLQLATRLKLPVLTTDRQWARLSIGVPLVLTRTDA